MKFKDILATAASNLWKNKVRTTLTVLATFIGAFAIALTSGLNIGVSDFINAQTSGLGAKDVILVNSLEDTDGDSEEGPKKYDPDINTDDWGFILLNDSDIQKLKKIEGVKDVRAIEDAQFDYIQGTNNDKYVFMGSEIIPGLEVRMEAGKQVTASADRNEITIDEDYVKALGYKNNEDAVGKEVTLGVTSATGDQKELKAIIAGVREKNVIINGGAEWISEKLNKEAIEINQDGLPDTLKGKYWGLGVVAHDENDVEKVKEEIEKAGYQAMTLEDQIKQIMVFVNAITGSLILFGAIALIAATFGIVNTLFMSVQERTREIGLMKALGLSRGKVFAIFSWEAALIGFFGALIGLLSAMGIGLIINNLASQSFLEGLPGLTLIKFEIIPSMIIILLIMFIAFIAGALPARRAAKLDPINALRSE